MKNFNLKNTLSLLFVAGSFLTSASVQADQDDNKHDFSGLYFGGGVGIGEYSSYTKDEAQKLLLPDFSIGQYEKSERYHVGYMINRIVGVELSYSKFPPFVIDENVSQLMFNPNVYSVQANVGYTWSNGIRLFGLAGLSAVEFNVDDKSVELESDVTGALKMGVGVSYTPRIDHGLSVRLGYEWSTFFDAPDDEVTHHNFNADIYKLRQITLGLSYKI